MRAAKKAQTTDEMCEPINLSFGVVTGEWLGPRH